MMLVIGNCLVTNRGFIFIWMQMMLEVGNCLVTNRGFKGSGCVVLHS
jgi:hypothetical protein